MLEKDLFKDYKPEVVEYDQEIDGGKEEFEIREDRLTQKDDLLEKMRTAKANAKGNQTTFRQNIRTENDTKFKDYEPVVVEYDPEIDGQGEFELREDRLTKKDDLLEKMRTAKSNAKGNQTTFRQNIRTENQDN